MLRPGEELEAHGPPRVLGAQLGLTLAQRPQPAQDVVHSFSATRHEPFAELTTNRRYQPIRSHADKTHEPVKRIVGRAHSHEWPHLGTHPTTLIAGFSLKSPAFGR